MKSFWSQRLVEMNDGKKITTTMSIEVEKDLMMKYSALRLKIVGDGLGGAKVISDARVRTGEYSNDETKAYYKALRGNVDHFEFTSLK